MKTEDDTAQEAPPKDLEDIEAQEREAAFAANEANTERIKTRGKEAREAEKKRIADRAAALKEISDGIPKDKRQRLMAIWQKESNAPPPLRLFLFGIIAGAFMGGYVLNWSPVGGLAKAFLMTQGQIFTWVLFTFAAGAAVPILLTYPKHAIQKKRIEKTGGVPVAIEYRYKSGQLALFMVPFKEQITIDEGRHVLISPSFTFMGVPGYRVIQGVVPSVSFSQEDIEVQVDKIAVNIEHLTTYEGPDKKKYTAVPRGDTIAALSAANLYHIYNYGLDLGLDQGTTTGEKAIKFLQVVGVATLVSAIIAAYFGYYTVPAIDNMSATVEHKLAEVMAATGANQ